LFGAQTEHYLSVPSAAIALNLPALRQVRLQFAAPPMKRIPITLRSSTAFLFCSAVAFSGSATIYKSGRNRAIFPADVTATTAYKIAQLDRKSCLAELDRRQIPYQLEAEAPGVKTPVRLKGSIGEVRFFTGAAGADREKTPYEVLDCRLVVALDEWKQVLSAHGVSDIVFSSGWRPAKLPGDAPQGKRHSGALALDVHAFRLKSGGELIVERDFHGRLDAPVCGSEFATPAPATPEARELRSIVCSTAELRIFQSILTPNYDIHHANHFHLEVTPNVRWFILS
jgi:hypothetical protein